MIWGAESGMMPRPKMPKCEFWDHACPRGYKLSRKAETRRVNSADPMYVVRTAHQMRANPVGTTSFSRKMATTSARAYAPRKA